MTEKVVTLPLSPTDMVEFFKDKSQLYVVDMSSTTQAMNERSLLLYLANLGIRCSFTEVTDKLLGEYITLNEFVNSTDLMGIHANVLGYIKYQEVFYPELEPVFSVDNMIDFAQANADTLAEQCVFLDSFMLYAFTRADDLVRDDVEKVNDELIDAISMTLVSLLNFEDFMIVYSQDIPPMSEQTYYSRYFDDYMFRGKNLFHYASTCPYFGLIAAVRSHESGVTSEQTV